MVVGQAQSVMCSAHFENFEIDYFVLCHRLACKFGNLFVCFLAIVVFIAADANTFCHVGIVSW